MNELGLNFTWTAARVTIITVAAMWACALAARSSPKSAARLSTWALASVILLTTATFCPWSPNWAVGWSIRGCVEMPESGQNEPDVRARHRTLGPDESAETGTLTAFVENMRAGLRQVRNLQPEKHRRWPMIVAVCSMAGIAFGVVRLAMGVCGVCACRRRCRPVNDVGLGRVVQALCEAIGMPITIEVRESPELTTAATIGWRRPCILVPSDWRSWDESEVRAVLAHELAHIRHGDYATGLLARLGVALHFYHPIVHWLAGRLRLQQELAADALAARFAGGRDVYLGALARLALRQEAPSLTWPARAFLPAPGTLMRRIQMLRTKHVQSSRWVGRLLPAGLMLAAVVGVAALGGPTVGSKIRAEEKSTAAADNLPAFDLSYVAPGALGVMAFRPAAAFKLPGLRPYLALVDELVRQSGKQIGLEGDFRLSVNDIEQVVGSHRLLHNPKAPEGQKHSLVSDLSMIRTVQPFDWKKKIEAMGITCEEIACEGGVYYKVSKPFLAPMMIPRGFFLYMPDDRSLVINTEENIKSFIQKKAPSTPECVWVDGWRRVEHDLFAVALDTRDEKRVASIGAKEPKDEKERLWIELLVKNAKQSVLGTGNTENIRLQAYARCESEACAKAALVITAALLAIAREDLGNVKPSNDSGRKMLAILAEMLDQTKVERHGSEVHWSVTSKLSLAELLANSVSAELKAEK